MKKRTLKKIIKCMVRALPGQIHGIYHEFKQLRRDRISMRGHKTLAKRLTTVWRVIFPAYQLGDDILEFALFVFAVASFGSGWAFVLIAIFSIELALVIALIERQVQLYHAKALQVQTVTYRGRLLPDVVDSLTNSAPWGVLRHASEPRHHGDPIKIVDFKRIIIMSVTYGVFNTILYLVADSLPGVNSWTGFLILLLFTMTTKGFIEEWTK